MHKYQNSRLLAADLDLVIFSPYHPPFCFQLYGKTLDLVSRFLVQRLPSFIDKLCGADTRAVNRTQPVHAGHSLGRGGWVKGGGTSVRSPDAHLAVTLTHLVRPSVWHPTHTPPLQHFRGDSKVRENPKVNATSVRTGFLRIAPDFFLRCSASDVALGQGREASR